MLTVQAYAELARMNFDTALALDQADLHNRKALHLFGLSAALRDHGGHLEFTRRPEGCPGLLQRPEHG